MRFKPSRFDKVKHRSRTTGNYEPNALESEYDQRKGKLFEAGPAMPSTIQHIVTKKLLALLYRILPSM
jgi:hypothetical protein